MAWAYTYDIATPDGADNPAEADDRMKEIKGAIQERGNVDHYLPLTGSEVSADDAFEHRKLTIRTLSAVEVAALAAAKAYLYRLVTDGELYFKDASGNTIQLTVGGKIVSASLDVTLQSIRDYADAAVAVAVAAAHPAYAGGESHTDGSGMITKTGCDACAVGETTINFAVAFPTACVRVVAVWKSDSNVDRYGAKVHSEAAARFKVENTNNVAIDANWIAIGY